MVFSGYTRALILTLIHTRSLGEQAGHIATAIASWRKDLQICIQVHRLSGSCGQLQHSELPVGAGSPRCALSPQQCTNFRVAG